MSEVTAIQFLDRDSGDEALITVRVAEAGVGLGLSLRQDGDVEVFVGSEELDKLIEALRIARTTIARESGSDVR